MLGLKRKKPKSKLRILIGRLPIPFTSSRQRNSIQVHRLIIATCLLIIGCGNSFDPVSNDQESNPFVIVQADGGLTDGNVSPLELIFPVATCSAPPIDTSTFTMHAVSYGPADPPETFTSDVGGIVDVSARTANILVPNNAEGLLPTVIDIHGGGWQHGDSDLLITQQLATYGYVSVGLNYRLVASADGGAVIDGGGFSGLENQYPASISDLRCAMRFIKRNAAVYHIDLTRLAVIGDSAGAQLATLLASADRFFTPNFDDGTCAFTGEVPSFKLVVSYYGAYNFRSSGIFIPSTVAVIEDMLGATMGARGIPSIASPFIHTAYAPPTLLIFGNKDAIYPSPVIPTEYFNALRASDIRSSILEIDGLGHGFPMLVPDTEFQDGGLPNISYATCTTLALFANNL